MTIVTVLPARELPVAEKLAWLRLLRSAHIGPVTFYNLLHKYGSASRAIEILPEVAQRTARGRTFSIAPLSAAEREYEAIEQAGAVLLAACEAAYPLALAVLEDAPPLLTVAGDAAMLNRTAVGIVGSRNASLNGRRFAEILARDLGRAEMTVISGLARGIDTAAHIGALETGTVAVVAGGVDIIYPPENKKLYDEIRTRGAVVAESPFGQQPFAQSFPRRNRIISGLSAGIVVVEASRKSGSLITARMAAEQGRDVYAVPGHPLDPRAEGPNHLIREGATLIRDAADVMETLHDFSGVMRAGAPVAVRPAPASSPAAAATLFPDLDDLAPVNDEATQSRLADQIGFAPVEIDVLIRAGTLPAGQVQALLLDMEMTGEIQRLPGNRVVRLK